LPPAQTSRPQFPEAGVGGVFDRRGPPSEAGRIRRTGAKRRTERSEVAACRGGPRRERRPQPRWGIANRQRHRPTGRWPKGALRGGTPL